MLSDNLAIALALVAAWLATRPATPGRSFGYKRAEVLAALANGVLLVALSIWIFVAAAQRLSDPPDVLGGWMLVIALVGIAVNLAAGAALVPLACGEPQRRGGLPPRAAPTCSGPRRPRGCGRDPRDRLVAGGSDRQHPHRPPRPGERVDDPARLDRDPARVDAARNRRARSWGGDSRARPGSSRCTICTSGRSRPASRRCPPTFSCDRARTATAAGASSNGFSARQFGIEHTTLQVDHATEGGLVEIARF